MIESILSNSSLILTVVAVICTIISAITEFTKEIGVFSKIPTTLQVLIFSLVICVVAFFAYLSYAQIPFIWYYLVAVIFASFLIAIICTKGWDYLFDIWKRYNRKDF